MSNPEQQGSVPAFELRHRLHRALEHGGVKVGAMASYLGVSDSTMTNYLSGATRPRAGAIRAWALATGVPFEWLLSGAETPSDLPGSVSARTGRTPRGTISPLLRRSA